MTDVGLTSPHLLHHKCEQGHYYGSVANVTSPAMDHYTWTWRIVEKVNNDNGADTHSNTKQFKVRGQNDEEGNEQID